MDLQGTSLTHPSLPLLGKVNEGRAAEEGDEVKEAQMGHGPQKLSNP
jgi:hypothetical protein